MDISKYNVICSDEKKVLIFNTLTSAMIKMSPEEWQLVETSKLDKVNSQILTQLSKMGILVENTDAQLLHFKYRFYRTAFGVKEPFLYIAPTMRCNFECFYCFEQGNKNQGLMSEATAQKIVQFLTSNNKKSVKIVWFGGEPMLGFKIILYLCQLLSKEGISFTSSMITNGSLFTEENIRLLSQLNLTFIQFSMDGIYETHDKRRCFIDGKPSFSIVIENLERILTQTKIPVIIQVTMDRQNSSAYDELKNFCFKRFPQFMDNGRLQIGFNNVQNRTGFDSTGSCFSQEELVSEEIHRIQTQNRSSVRIPSLSYPCMYRASWYYAIDPKGNLYKCIEQLGNPSERVGSLNEDFLSLQRMGACAFQEEAFSDPECRECSIFPICGGGCPLDRIKRAKGETREVCSKYKEGLIKILPALYEKLRQA